MVTPQLVRWMARSGNTDAQIAEHLKINQLTLYRWAKRYPAVREALAESRDFIDNLVEDSLLKRARGFEYTEKKIIHDPTTLQPVRVETTQKVVPGDVTAQIFWLKNRRPKQWRDVHKIEASVQVEQVKDAVQEVMGDEQLHEDLLEIGRRFDFTRSTDASPD